MQPAPPGRVVTKFWPGPTQLATTSYSCRSHNTRPRPGPTQQRGQKPTCRNWAEARRTADVGGITQISLSPFFPKFPLCQESPNMWQRFSSCARTSGRCCINNESRTSWPHNFHPQTMLPARDWVRPTVLFPATLSSPSAPAVPKEPPKGTSSRRSSTIPGCHSPLGARTASLSVVARVSVRRPFTGRRMRDSSLTWC